ncbi:hypothetical protein FRC17_007990, partial [Serendipita sp. 399]
MDPGKPATTGNERLPFDVLVQVFEYYPLNESTRWPVETLRLVCKAWNITALQCSPLWARFNIDLSQSNTGTFWLRRLPVRLQMCGPNQPLHIDIRYSLPDQSQWPFSKKAWDAMEQIRSKSVQSTVPLLLNILAGENGRLCARWETLRLELDRGVEFLNEDLAGLTYPMPLLISLYLSVQMSRGGLVIFPNLPSIRSITTNVCNLSNYPDASHATRIELRDMCCWDNGRSMKFTSVQYLSISRSGGDILHHREYPTLRTLCLEECHHAVRLMEAEMPRLENLIVVFLATYWLSHASQLRAVARVRVLHLFGQEHWERPTVRSVLSQLLNAFSSLQTLVVNEYVLSFLIEDRETWGHLFEEDSATQVFLRTRSIRRHLFDEENETQVSFSSTEDGDKRLTRGDKDSDGILGGIAS